MLRGQAIVELDRTAHVHEYDVMSEAVAESGCSAPILREPIFGGMRVQKENVHAAICATGFSRTSSESFSRRLLDTHVSLQSNPKTICVGGTNPKNPALWN